MICQRCMRRLSAQQGSRIAKPFPSSRITATQRASFASTSPRSTEPPPPATSTSAAQPFSTPLTPSLKNEGPPRKPSKSAVKLPASSVLAGTVLKGLNFMKNKQDPIALEDREYPEWLWRVLDKGQSAGGEAMADGEGDLFAKSKKQRQKAAKALRKQALLNPGALAPKIPLYEQSVDLPAGDGGVEASVQAAEARRELTKAMRQKRKAVIKEDNFLRSMR